MPATQNIAGHTLVVGSLTWRRVRLAIDDDRDASVMDALTSWANAGLSPRWGIIRQAELTGCSELAYED